MTVIILGGGLAGLSLAALLSEDSVILEKEKEAGGLCRSLNLNGISYDIGPHIFFSKKTEILNRMLSLVESSRLRRSNKIWHKGRLIKYPFENDLAALEPAERNYCLHGFLNNPYENYEAKNMLQFFLKTFGEGITKTYLQPYNEKIWKFDPAYMDTQMVDRIPKPPREDIIASANGIPTEGYTHQLYFHYPVSGGTQSLIHGLERQLGSKSRIITGAVIRKITRSGEAWSVETDQGNFNAGKLINCMPLQELCAHLPSPPEVKKALAELKYNSIYIVAVQASRDAIGDNFALNIADKNIIFHRISKVNFLGSNYSLPGCGATVIAEITFRNGDYLSSLSDQEIQQRVVKDLDALGFISAKEVTAIALNKFQYAYVIYDLEHRKNVNQVLQHLSLQGIECLGRFAEFEYLNMDHVLERSMALAQRMNANGA